MRAGFELSRRHGLEGAAVDFALVGGVVEREPEQGGNERRQPHRLGETVIEDEQLQQNRRAAYQLDVCGERRAHGAPAVHAPARDAHAEDDGERHRQT